MGNMGYCRFQNTVRDLQDCYDNLEDFDDLSPEEERAFRRMYQLCKDFVEDAENFVEDW